MEDEGEWEGRRDADGLWTGRGTLHTPDGGCWQGKMAQGLKQGRGVARFSDGATVEGSWRAGVLTGPGVYTADDGARIVGPFVDGILQGDVTEFDADGTLTFTGRYSDGLRDGDGVAQLPLDSGTLTGRWDAGSATGDGFVFAYPGGGVMLRGRWVEGEMEQARVVGEGGACVGDCFTAEAGTITASHICAHPLLPDPYESRTVFVAPSTVCTAVADAEQRGGTVAAMGEGLFAARDIAAGDLCAYYSGTRTTHIEVDARDGWGRNSNTMSLAPYDEVTVIDVPPPWDAVEAYCATLGHKVNHSPRNNAEYRHVTHPRFGHIKSVWAVVDIPKGEEILVDYGYTDEMPPWFTPDLYGRDTLAVLGSPIK